MSCLGAGAGLCDECAVVAGVRYYLGVGGMGCVGVCPPGQFGNGTDLRCRACDPGCATCGGTGTNCKSCTFVNTVDIVYLYQNTCVRTCITGFWHNSTVSTDHRCSLCHVFCTACTGPTRFECTSCGNSTDQSVIYSKDFHSSTCAQTCPIGQFVAPTNPNACLPCNS